MKRNLCDFELGGKRYPARYLNLGQDWGEVLVSVQSLDDVLFDAKGRYVSAVAERIDEEIFFFVDDGEIKKPERNLVQEILMEVS